MTVQHSFLGLKKARKSFIRASLGFFFVVALVFSVAR
jgi:hypothetical protein